MKTSAVVFVREGVAEMQSIEMPAPGKGQVQVRSRYSTVSAGTEGWCCKNLFTWSPTPYPCVPGYQRTGIITAIGEGVEGWEVGQKVMATTGAWEGPVKPFWGSHAAVANTWANELYHIPDGADEIDASAAVVAQVGYNAGYRPTLKPGDWVVVYGDGIIGQFGAQAARSRGAKVIMVGHRPERLELAARHSADAAINNATENVAETVTRLTGGKPVVAVIDTVQTESAQREYVPLLENWVGQVVYSGFSPGKTWADMALLQQHQLTTHNVAGWTRPRMEATLSLMAQGKMRLRPLITHMVSPATGAEIWRMIIQKTTPFLGITFDWTGVDA